jgi:hypothetical protein
VTQRTTQRAAARVEERKQRGALEEARRTEQVRALLEFLGFAHEAEGVAHARPPSWDVGDDWYRTARPAMDGLRVAEKSVELLCAASLRAPTASYGRALNQAVWQERADMPIGEQLEPFRAAFLSAARQSLGSAGQGEPAN